MKLLLDVCVSSRSLQASLVSRGHDVLSAVAELTGAVIITVTRGRIRIRRQSQDPR